MPHVRAVRGGALLGMDPPVSRGVSLAPTSGRELSSPQLFLALSLGRFGVQERCGLVILVFDLRAGVSPFL